MSPFETSTTLGGKPHGVRLTVELAIGLAIAFLALRTWCIAWFVVASGSMAPALVGPHVRAVCPECEFTFDCGIEGPESLGRPAVCPNCGAIGDPIDEAAQASGNRLPVHQTAFTTRLPRRWEVVAFRQPAKAGEICVKRVVGLPGESIDIRDGDVFVDGQILRKSLPEQRAMAVLVHDNNFRPQSNPTMPPRWRAEQGDSLWQANDGGFVHPTKAGQATNDGWHALSEAKGVERGETTSIGPEGVPAKSAVATSMPSASPGIDWLTYHHQRRVAGVPHATEETPLVDAYGYNQTRPVLAQYAIHDVLLSCRIKASGGGVVAFRACDGDDTFIALLDPSRKQAQLHRFGQRMLLWELELSALTAGALVEVSLIDRQFLLAIDGQPLLSMPYERTSSDLLARQWPGGDGQPTARPLAIGSLGAAIEVQDLRVLRDVYYVPIAAADSPLGGGISVRLTADEYYMLGDNSPLSHDSRSRSIDAAVPAKLLLGKPLILTVPW